MGNIIDPLKLVERYGLDSILAVQIPIGLPGCELFYYYALGIVQMSSAVRA